MLCSNCSHDVKPIVALDIDGTLGDYHQHFLDFADQYLDIEIPRTYDGRMHFKDWFCDWAPATERDWHNVKLAYRQGGMKRTMPIIKGAQELCHTIQAAGAELWLTTTRPYLSLDNVVPDTVEWCRRHYISFDGLLFDDDKYRVLAQRVSADRVVAVFDDIPELVSAANTHFRYRAWLIRSHWNRARKSARMCEVDTAGEIAVHAINKWKEEHANG